MKLVFWSRLDLAARRFTPIVLTLMLVLINVMPLQVPGLVRVMPLLPLMSIYLWAVHHPDLMPIYAVFLIGLLQDILGGIPIGVYGLTYLTVYAVVIWQRRFLAGKSFMVIWVGYMVVGAGAVVIGWILISAYNAVIVDPGAMAFQYLISVGVFPLLAWLVTRCERAFVGNINA